MVIHSAASTSPDQGAGREARHCATCRCDTRHTCTCGHQDVHHGISLRGIRTACSVHEGPKGTPCGCLAYTLQEADHG